MKTLLLTATFACFSFLSFGQEVGLRFNSSMFEPVQMQTLTTHWKSELLPRAESDYLLFQLSQINLPEMYFHNSLALFCRLEVKMERAASFPVKFRLGTVEYVDWLEQKRFYTNLELGY